MNGREDEKVQNYSRKPADGTEQKERAGLGSILKGSGKKLRELGNELIGAGTPELYREKAEDSRQNIHRRIEILNKGIKAASLRCREENTALDEVLTRAMAVYNSYLRLRPGYNEIFCREFYKEGGIIDCASRYQEAVRSNADAIERPEELQAFLCHNYLNTFQSALERLQKLQASENTEPKEANPENFREIMKTIGIEIPEPAGSPRLVRDWENFLKKYSENFQRTSALKENCENFEKRLESLNAEMESRERKRYNLEAVTCDYEAKLQIETRRKTDRENCERIFRRFLSPQVTEMIVCLKNPIDGTAEEYRRNAKMLASILGDIKDEDI